MKRVPPRFLKVAVFAPLRALFDYACPERTQTELAGCRVLVPFGRSTRVGIVVAVTTTSTVPPLKIKNVIEILDSKPVIERALLDLATWAVDYYHCPPGDVFEALLSTELRHGKPLRDLEVARWEITSAGRSAFSSVSALGARQREILGLTAAHSRSRDQLLAAGVTNLRVVTDCVRRGWLRRAAAVAKSMTPAIHAERFLTLNAAQATAIGILRAGAGYHAYLLHGITGSGKTEIYLHLVRDALLRTGQALILIPEIGLTEQLVKRFAERFGETVAVIHSSLSERARATVWQRCRAQEIRVLVGTRSAVWMPLPSLQLIVVDEEHDMSYKQQEGMRYSARDLAVVRAHRQGIPVVLGSATPSLESLANCARGKYQYVEILTRARGAKLPKIRLLDVRGQRLEAGISVPLQQAVRERAARGEQSLLFLNRRGFAPIVLCHHCGWIANCPRCDARLVLHQAPSCLRCHHCGTERKVTAAFPEHPCGKLTEYASLGVGTEQLEGAFPKLFPGLRAIRIDRDSVSRKGQLDAAFTKIRAGEVDILVGTQMIAKGHDFSNVTLVGIVDGDSGLLATDFRAEERFVQLVLQVAGRAGRGDRPGEVLIQSHHPQHPVFDFLCRGSYRDFAQHALQERAAAELPPHTSLVLLRAEATERALPLRFLNQLAVALKRTLPAAVSIGGPVPALMERRIGKFRANLLLTAEDRASLASATRQLLAHIESMPLANKIRWTLDVDAQEIS